MSELPEWAVLVTVIVVGNVLYVVIGRWLIDWHYDRKNAAQLAHFDAIISLMQAPRSERGDIELDVLLRPEVRDQFHRNWLRTHWRR